MNLKEAKLKRQARLEDNRLEEKTNDEFCSGAEPVNNQNEKGDNKMEEQIRDGIEKIRPFLQRDGGDIEFVEYTDDNVVKVRLLGHCQGCPHRQATINGMVYQVLHEAYPEVAGVVAVD